MKISLATRLGLGFLPAIFALLTAGALFYVRLADVEQDGKWVAHTLEVLQHLDNTRAHLAEAKSSASAFQLTLHARHQQDFDRAVDQSEQTIASLQRLTGDNPDQQRRLAILVPALKERFRYLSSAMSQARFNHARTQQGVALDEEAQLDPIGAHTAQPLINEMQATERALLQDRRDQQATTLHRSVQAVVAVTLLSTILVLLLAAATIHRITRPLLRLEAGARRVGEGDYQHRLESSSEDEVGRVATVFNQMVDQIQARETMVAEQTWIKSSLASFTPIFQGGQDLQGVCEATLAQLASLLDAPCLALYRRQERDGAPGLTLCAAYATTQAPRQLDAGEGLAGQCLVDGQTLVLDELPADFLRITSALGSTPPRQVVVIPVFFESQVRAVLEIALLKPLSGIQREFLQGLAEGMGLMLNAFEAKLTTETALHTQTELSETLQREREALQHSNEELAMQSEQLRASERLAREQQEELRLANEEQHQANLELRQLTHTLDIRAQQLAEVSAVKSEFLANMSHELRTPLNSLLILSKLLAEDSDHPLSAKQQQYARTIHESGNDLLQQINEILDMARIESGKVHIDTQTVALAELVRLAESTFRPVAQTRHLSLDIQVNPAVGPTLRTDQGRVWQIIKNLMANAFKFTAEGGVTLRIEPALSQVDGAPSISLSVHDTGIGIPQDKQAQIFEAFRQGDSGIARQYGGTGLGLSISLKLAQLLGGTLQVSSEPGQGSIFTLILPLSGPPQQDGADSSGSAHETGLPASSAPVPALPRAVTPPPETVGLPADEPSTLGALVVVSDHQALLHHLAALASRRHLTLVQSAEVSDLVNTCAQVEPALVILDTTLDGPVMWTALGHLKQDHRTRHIAVHVLCHPAQRQRALRLGAASLTMLPLESTEVLVEAIGLRLDRLTQPQRNVLVVEDDDVQRGAILDLIGNGDIKATGVATAEQALAALAATRMDCLVLDLGLPDMDGMTLLGRLNEQLGSLCPPVIVYTAQTLPRDRELELMKNAQALIVKGAHSPERLIDELTLLLSRWPSHLSPATRALIDRSRQHDPVLAGRKVLVVDDDVRNIFAVSAALETYGAQVVHAEGGLEGIEVLKQNSDTSIVLMDIMMPNIDGLEAIRRIRALPEFSELPIVAVTAKAMPGDRDNCLAAGASDYLSKPVDMDHLRAMIRVWLSR